MVIRDVHALLLLLGPRARRANGLRRETWPHWLFGCFEGPGPAPLPHTLFRAHPQFYPFLPLFLCCFTLLNLDKLICVYNKWDTIWIILRKKCLFSFCKDSVSLNSYYCPGAAVHANLPWNSLSDFLRLCFQDVLDWFDHLFPKRGKAPLNRWFDSVFI